MSRADSPLRDRLILSVGARRSGTFWLHRIITAHPQVSEVPGETYFFSHGIAPLFDRFSHGVRASPQLGEIWVEREPLLDAARDFCDSILAGYLEDGATHLCERTPWHVHHLDLIGEIYPDARVVHIIRDGRDVARSLLAKDWGPTSIEEAAGEWREAVLAGRRAQFPGTLMEVRYEELLTDPEPRIRRLFEALGLAVDDRIVGLAVAEARERANVDPESPNLEAAKWKTQLTGDDLRVFDRIAGDLVEELGYEPSGAGAGRVKRRRLRRVKRRPAASGIGESVGAVRNVPDKRSARVALHMLDDLVEAMQGGRPEAAADLLAADFELEVVNERDRLAASGPEAASKLVELLAHDPVSGGKQRRAEIFAKSSSVAAVVAFDLPGGTETERIYVLTTRGDRIGRLGIYKLPEWTPAARS